MQALFSEHWHAVRFLRPRLRDGVQVLHRNLRGRAWVLLYDPVAQRFHRITPEVFHVLELMDGRRSLDEMWAVACALPMHGEHAAIGQQELVQLLSQLYTNDLLQTQISPDAHEVFDRYRKQQRAKLQQSLLNPISMKFPLLYPDAWFSKYSSLAQLLFNRLSLLVWLAAVLPAMMLAWEHWGSLTENMSDRVLSLHNLFLLWGIYPIVKIVHEWAHGMAVKRWGGAVREIGLMLIVFMPVPYVDATSSYRFPSKWARATVAAAGIMAELFLGALALYVWLLAEPGWVSAVAYNVILIAGVSTVLVNGNPLMRYDGYFIACDVLEVPNLAQRATQYWTYLIDRYVFGAQDAHMPQGAERERILLVGYGLVAPVYRLGITVGLIWFVASQYFFIGAALAIVSAWMSLVMPLWKAWKHVSEGSSLARRREIAMRRTVLTATAGVLLLALVPLPFYSVHEAVVWLPDRAIVRADSAGQVDEAFVQSGQMLAEGQLIAQLNNPQLSKELAVAQAGVELLNVRIRAAELDNPVQAHALRKQLQAEQTKVTELSRKLAGERLLSPWVGRWVSAQPTQLQGRYLRRGEIAGYVVDQPSRLLRVAITQEDMQLVRQRAEGIEVRLVQAMRTPMAAHIVREVPGGEDRLVSPALGTNGGGAIPVDPAQADGTKTLRRVFDIEIELQRPAPRSVFGDRAYVRIDLGWAPLGWQWFLRLRQLFLSRLSV